MSEKPFTTDFTSSDKIIAVMGPPGAGKSTFVASASETGEEGVSHDLQNPSCQVRVIRAKSKINDHPVVFVDAPGFDDGIRSDYEILEKIADFLVEIYNQHVRLAGIIYIHPIVKNRMDGTQTNGLRIFKTICGDDMSGVTIVSSMWGLIDSEIGAKREAELKEYFWKEYMDRGCTTKRFKDGHESAVSIIADMINGPGIELQLQKEMMEEGKALGETKAAQAVPTLRGIFKFCKHLSGWTNKKH